MALNFVDTGPEFLASTDGVDWVGITSLSQITDARPRHPIHN